MVRLGTGRKAPFFSQQRAIGNKGNAADRLSPCRHRPQGVMQDILKSSQILDA